MTLYHKCAYSTHVPPKHCVPNLWYSLWLIFCVCFAYSLLSRTHVRPCDRDWAGLRQPPARRSCRYWYAFFFASIFALRFCRAVKTLYSFVLQHHFIFVCAYIVCTWSMHAMISFVLCCAVCRYGNGCGAVPSYGLD